MTLPAINLDKRDNRNRIYQYVAAVTANLGIICSEMHYGWPSPYIPVLENGNYTFTISSEEGSWLTVIPLIGAMCGALVTGLIVDIFGRKRLIVLSSLPFLASWLMVALAPSSTLMFIGRFIAGASDGLSFTAVPMYLGEIAEPKIRGLLASICPVSVVFGVILLITYSWMPESPYFHVMKGDIQSARRSLEIFRGTKDVDEELQRISEAVKQQNENKGSMLDLFTVKSNRKGLIITLGLRGFQQLSGTTAIIFYCKTIFEQSQNFISSSHGSLIYFAVQLILSAVSSVIVDFAGRRPLLIVSISGTAISLLIQGIYLYLKIYTDIDMARYNFIPIIALISFVVLFSTGLQTIPLLMMGLRGVQQLSGSTAIILHCKTIFQESEGSISANTAVIIYCAIQLFLSAISSFIVDITGRRPLLILSASATSVTLLVQGLYLYFKTCTNVDTTHYNAVPIVALLCFIVTFCIGLNTIPLLMLGEIFPTNVKASAVSLADMYYDLFASVSSKFFHWSSEEFGLHVPFFVFFCTCLLGLTFIIFLVPETKGKTLEDIQAELKGEKKPE
ncbi:unnamed protein product [Callosobruchus maculatus]|uniref:Major facilitator superfamily (MFS) profile domain-containing protein n=1 Tax=Callosobruchus maculatus TaxID=64391 RepID=A0A653C9R8_CALMS|nr:unnamed protein product [Callosobruchus maculatus]